MLLASVLRDGGLLTYKEDKIEHEAGKQPDGSGRLYSGDFTPVGAGGKAVSYLSLIHIFLFTCLAHAVTDGIHVCFHFKEGPKGAF